MPTTHRYFIEYEPNTWDFADLTVDDDGLIECIKVNDTPINVQKPGVYCCYDDLKPSKAYWLGIDGGSHLYQIDYNTRTRGAEKAKPLCSPSSKFVTIPKEIQEKLPLSGDSAEALFKLMSEEGNRHYVESQRIPSMLLTCDDIEALLVRPADEVRRDQLMGVDEDVVLAKTQAFQIACNEQYINQVKKELTGLLESRSSHYTELKSALIKYLNTHWQSIKGTPLSYTSLAHHPVTALMIHIATKLEYFDRRPAISYLMPDIYTEVNSTIFLI